MIRYSFAFGVWDYMLLFPFFIEVVEPPYPLVLPFAKLNRAFIIPYKLAPLLICPILANICPFIV